MTPDKYDRLKGLFELALETPPKHREEMIRKVREADEELGRELEALLAGHTDSGADGTGADRTDTMDRPVIEFHGSGRERPSFSQDEVLLDRFRIVRFLGRGGMGEVYEAEDLQLGRVALKTIRADLGAHPRMMERFRQEVQMARKVTSRNVCRIHDLFPFPAGDRRSTAAFLTMELLEGVTLADRIDSQGPLPLPEALATALQLCTALQAIHDAGVIHRDIKGRNVMLVPRNGATQAVVMDLGLARESVTKAEGADTGLTVPGSVVGTPHYMAPEQFEGKQATPATDIYALGVLLYEMVTGKLPFEGSTPLQAAVRRGKQPPSASSVRGKLPRQWDVVIRRCLEFEPEARYQSGDEVAAALQGRRLIRWGRVGAVAAAVVVLAAGVVGVERLMRGRGSEDGPKTVVVLPFYNVGGDAANQTLSDGLQETVTSMLAQVGSSVQVVPASDLRSNQVKTIADARSKFNANLVLTGSVQKSGDSLQLTLNLNDAQTQRQRDSRMLVIKPEEMASLPQQLAGKIDSLLGAGSSLRTKPEGPGEGTRDSEAYRLYIQGTGALQDLKLDEAVDDLQKAVDKDPEFSAAGAKLAEACVKQYRKSQDSKWLARADSVLNQAGRTGQSAEVSLAQAMIWQATAEHEKAAQLLQQLVQGEPNNVEIREMLADSLAASGRRAEAEEAYQTAIRLRPGSWPAYNAIAGFYVKQAEYQKAEHAYRDGIAAAPEIPALHTNLGGLYFNHLGQWDDAAREFQKSVALNPTYAPGYSNVGTALYYDGKYADAARQFETATKLLPSKPLYWGNLGDARWQLAGERERAREAYAEASRLAGQQLLLNPDQAEVESYYALDLVRLGRAEEAVVEIEKAIKLNPKDTDVRFYAARVFASKGDMPGALTAVRECVAVNCDRHLIERDPDLAGLRQDPRYNDLGISRK